MTVAGVLPLTEYPGGPDKPWMCCCLRCGTVVHPRYEDIKRGGGGCRKCAKYGFKASEKAVVYLIDNPENGAVKVGITDATGARLKRHAQRGWRVRTTVRVPGERALTIEKAVLSSWRNDQGLPPFLGKEEMPQGGWTETVDADAINILDTIERIRTLATGA